MITVVVLHGAENCRGWRRYKVRVDDTSAFARLAIQVIGTLPPSHLKTSIEKPWSMEPNNDGKDVHARKVIAPSERVLNFEHLHPMLHDHVPDGCGDPRGSGLEGGAVWHQS